MASNPIEEVSSALSTSIDALNKALDTIKNQTGDQGRKKKKPNTEPFQPILYIFTGTIVALALMYLRGVLADRQMGKALSELASSKSTDDILKLSADERLWGWIELHSNGHDFRLIYCAILSVSLITTAIILFAWYRYPDRFLSGRGSTYEAQLPTEDLTIPGGSTPPPTGTPTLPSAPQPTPGASAGSGTGSSANP